MLPRALLVAAGLSLVSLTALADPLVVEDAQVRAVPPGSQTSAAFMTLRNPGQHDVVLVAAETPVAEAAELHDHRDVDGVMQMRRVPQIVVPAGGSTELAPGGLHMMLIGLVAPLAEGEPVEIELRFETGETQRIEAPVRRIVADAAQAGHTQGHAH
ncbi:copper chaperone PCu(A)C [Halomonas sp. MCCC 1A17488]|uniref:Copper chaperone PCu(A)C n=2 Tax=Oceanospirillales TaxID=135619 RepID=A0ABX7WC95_9GAMM|nr:copper chaperone PCu(A)C [Halomonas sp. MCCC 1A17488]MCG3241456.1 copper chaperone PCu(A)C [Halomonas sp. MCCC 1A17488]QTP57142.1 copper chaperone PCu(A)C [Halomonas sulfidoxydans]